MTNVEKFLILFHWWFSLNWQFEYCSNHWVQKNQHVLHTILYRDFTASSGQTTRLPFSWKFLEYFVFILNSRWITKDCQSMISNQRLEQKKNIVHVSKIIIEHCWILVDTVTVLQSKNSLESLKYHLLKWTNILQYKFCTERKFFIEWRR